MQYRDKYPTSNEGFCGRASCRRRGARQTDNRQMWVTPIQTVSFSDPGDLFKEYPVKGFRAFDKRRRIATQKLFNGATAEAVSMFRALYDDMLCRDKGVTRGEFLNRKMLFSEWARAAIADMRVEEKEPPPALGAMSNKAENLPHSGEYRTRTVWRKLSPSDAPFRS